MTSRLHRTIPHHPSEESRILVQQINEHHDGQDKQTLQINGVEEIIKLCIARESDIGTTESRRRPTRGKTAGAGKRRTWAARRGPRCGRGDTLLERTASGVAHGGTGGKQDRGWYEKQRPCPTAHPRRQHLCLLLRKIVHGGREHYAFCAPTCYARGAHWTSWSAPIWDRGLQLL